MSDEPPWASARAAILALVAGIIVLVVVPLVTREPVPPRVDIDAAPTLTIVERGFTVQTGVAAYVSVLRVGANARVVEPSTHRAAGEHAFTGSLAEGHYIAFACLLPVLEDALLAAARAERPGLDGCTFDVVTKK